MEGAPALEVHNLSRRFGATKALDGLSFQVARGQLFGLVGADGAGKTTVIRALAGLINVDGGHTRVLGRDPAQGGSAVRESLGLMPQQASLYPDLSVAENLRFFARLYCLPRALYRERRERLLGITRLGSFLDRRADALSGGMYKKLALACALLHRPEVLLLDEPTNGVDPVSRRELWALLHELVHDGMTVLLSTPYMDEAERCHHVGLIHHGRLLLQGEPGALLAAFANETYLIEGGERERVDQALAGLSSLVASSPAGSTLRITVTAGARTEVARLLAPLGAELRPVPPSFEDLFLSQVREGAAA
jgi:ABC-2 type transport system ATP-binding protein